jgi:ABC-2 type transport system ATP-binding protein
LSGVLSGLRLAGMTLIVSSHILTELEDYSTDMLIIHGGRVLEHKPLGQAMQRASSVVALELAEDVGDLIARLSAISGIEIIAADGKSARLRLDGTAQARADLLRRLVGDGLPVAGLTVEHESLQDSYLSRVAEAKSGKIAQATP